MRITRGRILAQRIFDIADEVDLLRAKALVNELSRRPHFVRSGAHIRLPNPPLEMHLPPRSSGVPGLSPCNLLVRLYDVGALAVTFIIEIPCPMDPEDLIAFGAKIFDAEDHITQAARPVATEILKGIAPACKLPQVSTLYEDHTVFYLEETSPALDGEGLLHALDVARLLMGEPTPLAESERTHVTQGWFSYSPKELVVVDWNSSLIYAPASEIDVAELLELTAMQLLELRVYNDVVERALNGLYMGLEQGRALRRSTHYQRLAHRTMRLFVEIMELSERVDNSLQFLGDTWLARIHRSAVREFDIPRWQRQLRDKLEVLRQINELLVDQITAQKSFNVEMAIVILIVIEILFAVFKVI